jgi:hypothetical protein
VSAAGCLWSRTPPKARYLFSLAALLLCGAAAVVAEGLWFRARADRVDGTVIDHDRKGRPVVAYWWGGQAYQHNEHGPSDPLPVGASVGVYVPRNAPAATRLDSPIGLLFLPGWACLMPAAFFAMYGLVVAFRGRRAQPEAGVRERTAPC